MKNKKAKAGDGDSFLSERFQDVLLDGYESRHPFTVKRSIVGCDITCKFDLTVAHRELLTTFLAAVLAGDERVNGRTLDSYTEEERRAILASHEEERRQFIPLVFELFGEQVVGKVEEALGQLFAEVKWQTLHRLGFPVELGKLRQRIEEASLAETKRRLDVPGSGRYAGSVESNADRLHKAAENERKILDAVGKLYDEPDKFWKVKRSDVVEELGISERTLSRWLRACGKDFDELVEIAENRQRQIKKLN
jgi:hypothetical protein